MSGQLKILLDECAPRLVKTRLPAFGIRTVQEMGWAGIKNGELLALAEAQFAIFVTADKRPRYQQNLAGRRLAVIVLPSNQYPFRRVAAVIEQALQSAQPGAVIEIPLPSTP